MPTGYTAPVADGSITELKPLALQFARGMGALITMRDEPHDAEIPKRLEPYTKWNEERLAAARARLSALQSMDEATRTAECAAYNEGVERANAEVIARDTETRNRYNAMIAKVVEWKGAPEGLKEFMLEQLHSGRDFDCSDDPTQYMPPKRDVADWYREELGKAAREVGYHEGEIAKEIARTAGRNAWLEQLWESLK